MKVTIKLPSVLKDECEFLIHNIELDDSLNLRELVKLMGREPWGHLVVENDAMKPPFVLVIDGDLALLKERGEMEVADKSVIQVIPLLTGGLLY